MLARDGIAVVLAVAAMNAGVHGLLPPEWPFPDLARKLPVEDFEPRAAVVFLGSSLTRRGIDPHVVDSVVGELGGSTRSFNLGAQGYVFPRSRRALDHVIERHPSTLRTVVFELTPPSPPAAEELHTARGTYWLTPGMVGFLRRYAVGDTAARHPTPRYLLGMLEGGLHVGLGWPAVHLAVAGSDTLDVRRRGYAPFPPERVGVRAPPIERLRRSVARVYQRRMPPPDTVLLDFIATMREDVRQAGLELVLLIPPRQGPATRHVRAAAYSAGVPVFDLADPALHPRLYAAETSGNLHHLNDAGARLQSAAVARCLVRLAERLEGDRPLICDGAPGRE